MDKNNGRNLRFFSMLYNNLFKWDYNSEFHYVLISPNKIDIETTLIRSTNKKTPTTVRAVGVLGISCRNNLKF